MRIVSVIRSFPIGIRLAGQPTATKRDGAQRRQRGIDPGKQRPHGRRIGHIHFGYRDAHPELAEPATLRLRWLLEREGALSPALANAALAAARNWTFAPSRVDDIPVASQMIIRFYFSP